MNFKAFIPLCALVLFSLLAPLTYAKTHKAKDSTTVTIPTEKTNVPASGESQVYKKNSISRSEHKNQPIQGKEYDDRTNGVYDLSISDDEVALFLSKLKDAVKSNELKSMEMLFHYPFTLYLGNNKKITISSKTLFKKHYEQITGGKFKEVVNKSSIDTLFVNSRGFMIGNGEVWFEPRLGIITVTR